MCTCSPSRRRAMVSPGRAPLSLTQRVSSLPCRRQEWKAKAQLTAPCTLLHTLNATPVRWPQARYAAGQAGKKPLALRKHSFRASAVHLMSYVSRRSGSNAVSVLRLPAARPVSRSNSLPAGRQHAGRSREPQRRRACATHFNLPGRFSFRVPLALQAVAVRLRWNPPSDAVQGLKLLLSGAAAALEGRARAGRAAGACSGCGGGGCGRGGTWVLLCLM